MVLIFKSFGGLPSSYWVVPGKRNEGYCNVKENKVISIPLSWNVWAKALLKFAIPPLNGKAGPIIITLLVFKI